MKPRLWFFELGKLAPMYFAVFLMRFSFGLVVLSLPIYLQRRSNIELGVIAAAYPVAEMLSVTLFGLLADKIGRKPLILAGLATSASVLFTFPHTTDVALLTIIHGIQGIAAAMIVASSLAMVADHAPERFRGREMGLYDFANVGGYAVGPFVASVLIETASIAVPFYAASAIALFAFVGAFVFVEDIHRLGQRPHVDLRESFGELVKNRSALAMFPVWFAITTFLGIGLTFAPKLAAQQGHRPMVAGAAFALVAIILAFTQPFYGYLSDKLGRFNVMFMGLVSLIGLLATLILSSVGQLSSALFFPLVIVLGLGSFSFAPAALAMLADMAPEKARGTTMGIYSFVISLGTIVGPLLGGYVLDRYSLLALYYVCAGFLLVAMVLTVTLVRSGHRK